MKVSEIKFKVMDHYDITCYEGVTVVYYIIIIIIY